MTDVDGLHAGFLATDENGQRLFRHHFFGRHGTKRIAHNRSACWSTSWDWHDSALDGFRSGRAMLTISGSGFVTITNPDGESVSLDAAITAN